MSSNRTATNADPNDLYQSAGINIDPIDPNDLYQAANVGGGITAPASSMMQQQEFNPSFMEKLAPNALVGLAKLGHPLVNLIASGLDKAGFSNAANAVHQPDYDYSKMMKLPGTPADEAVQSMVKTTPSMLMPGMQTESALANILSRVGGQAAVGAATNDNRAEGAKEFGGMQAVIDLLGGAVPHVLSGASELMHPEKFAGKTAEQIRNLAQEGHAEAQTFYNPVHAKYDDHIMTLDPEKYLGFTPEDKQYFKPDVNRAFRDFKAEPTFANLHMLQSKMGAYPDLYPMREDVKGKIINFLQHDPKSLEAYQKASDIMRDKYYAFTPNKTLKDIVEYDKPIKKADPVKLSKAISEAPIVDKARKSATPLEHPMVDLDTNLKNAITRGKALQFGLPTAIGTIIGHGSGLLGHAEGGAVGAAFGRYAEPQIVKFAQNEWVKKVLENYLRPGVQGVGRQAIGYNMENR